MMPEQGFVCLDATCIYIVLRTVLITLQGGVIIMKMDDSFNVIWENSFQNSIAFQQVTMTQDQSSIVFSLQSTTNWPVAKINSSSGLLELQKRLNSVVSWHSTSLNTDDTKVYISGSFMATESIIVLNANDFSFISIHQVPTNIVVTISPYGSDLTSNKIVVNSIIVGSGIITNTFSMDIDSNTVHWSKIIQCPANCNTGS